MKVLTSSLLALACAAALSAQMPFQRGARGERNLEQVTALLNLQPEQIAQMQANQRESRQALREVMQQNAQDRKELKELLTSENPDAFRVGELTLKLRGMGEQLKAKRAEVREKNLALLNPDQLAALQDLEAKAKAAAELAPTIRQAGALNLMEGVGMGGHGSGGAGFRGRGKHASGMEGARGKRGGVGHRGGAQGPGGAAAGR